MVGLTWLVPVLPLVAYLLLLAVGKRMSEAATTTISVLAVFIGFIISIGVVSDVAGHGPYAPVVYNWLAFGPTTITMGYQVTSLNALMLVVVTLVSTLVFLFSKSYMHGDERFTRFYQYLNLFVFSMLGLVITSNLLELYIFWELVGVCSYLLVGFWYFKPEAAVAAKKAFVVTRIGDVGLFIGVILLYLGTGSFDFSTIFAHLHHFSSMQAGLGTIGRDAITRLMTVQGWVTISALLVFVGAVGKSAQFPLHVWLPDAMEGPTPVSALIHAATMVAAGVYLVARMFPLFQASPGASETVAIIGGFTAIFAASIGLTQRDIKRVIAYSTVSQLGYMMLAMGVGAYVSGMFHLMTHAFFKALLFLAAGSVIHAIDTQDLFEMGGLRKYMPITHATFLAGALALSGIPPFAGFWSKDDILTATFDSGHYVLYAFGLIAAFFTAVYIFRVYFLTFSGTYKGNKHPHEGSWVMTLPLIVLGLLATFAGFINTPFAPFLGNFLQVGGPIGYNPPANWGLMGVSAVTGLLGIWVAYSLYSHGKRADAFAKRMGILYHLSFHKWYIDELYAAIIVLPVVTIADGLQFLDRYIVDGLVRLIGEIGYTGGISLKYSADGQVQTYGLVTVFGIAIVVLAALRIGGVL
ncbi:MAG: NADH-quinone oxidoreductase subunit L [Acidibacillus sp.]|uniref:NADH-quinone oxidoreductase subunit L n=1 Tax=Sulfoacidibacillus ferrooxidans TaxID=2005001 RepID=A0A9X2ADG5_9BACL|nr:NADH-quinone oxidoreductase subunit L [Sulfoacidibacillus ferrooxidans]MCI0183385.1 NADH-quinone oxidoreductase subunit L [Sulfoacidibacillus ferrooxidans]MCY0892295.1 NADH-quinone oxidoreductase subunit L [Acidibacillus sp.]